MPAPNPAALDFLLTRRSCSARKLTSPAPGEAALRVMLTAAARIPDHGKLVPWRFVVIRAAAQARLAEVAAARAKVAGHGDVDIEKTRCALLDGPLIVAVAYSPKPSDRVPEHEQLLSAGAVCLSLLNAALASGYGANWLTGWITGDRPFLEGELGLTPKESIAGFIHVGTESAAPSERPRPDLDQIVSHIDR